jgi:3-oxoacyl-[acyl-carrier-protein] synthase-3
MAYESKILGVGSFVPAKAYTNFDLEKMLDTSDEWIQQRTGIIKRHWVEGNVSNTDLAVEACKEAMEKAKVSHDDIDMIIFATLSPDHDFPGNACFLQEKLNIPAGIAALDIRQQCTGFVYGLSITDQFIKSGQYKNILLVGSEVHSKGLDRTPEGRNVSVLFGDGAGAAVIGRSDGESKVFGSLLHADGRFAKELWVAAPGTGNEEGERISTNMLDKKLHYPYMNGRQVFTHAVKRMAESLSTLMASHKMSIDDVDLFLFHQANIRINDKVAEILEIDSSKVFNTIADYGNTTAATIPIGMNDALKAGKLERGMVVGIAAFGAGFTWGSNIIVY